MDFFTNLLVRLDDMETRFTVAQFATLPQLAVMRIIPAVATDAEA